MIILVSIIMGFFSGLLICFELRMVFPTEVFNHGKIITELFVAITFFGGWILTAYLIAKGTKSVSRAFSRGFLIGAAEWLLLIPVGFISGGKAFSHAGQNTGEQAGAAILGGGIIGFLTTGVAIAMAITCLIAFAVSHSLGKEMKPEAAGNTKKCPQCAEMIKPDAKKCRFCGATLA